LHGDLSKAFDYYVIVRRISSKGSLVKVDTARLNLTLTHFKNRHKGGRCFIVCNGPSLSEMDLTALSSEVVFGLNKIYLGLDRFGFYPRYLVVVNEKVIRQSIDYFDKLTCVKFIGDRYAGYIKSDALNWRINSRLYVNDFSLDLNEGVQEGNTVTYAALQIAYYMGFERVVIIGMDHRYSYQGGTNETQILEGPDSNHFSDQYFQDLEWDTPDLQRSAIYYAKAREIFERDGRTIVDATLNGACEVFSKIDYAELFQ